MKAAYLKNAVPSMFTLGNLLCGFLAVANVIEGSEGAMISAAWWIIIAAIMDALDGKVARLTGTASRFGVEFDSIVDAVSFGMAPAVLFYQYALSSGGRIGLALGFCFLAAGTIRLARFNITATTGEKSGFTGMPIPAGAGLLASYVLFNEKVWGGLHTYDFALGLVVLTSLAMVSRFRYAAFPKMGFRSRKSTIKTVLFIGNIILIAFLPDEVLFLEGIIYLFSGPVCFLFAPAVGMVFHRANGAGINKRV
ncbi:MAG TPA: CDP-diacylglycerol--serine O-phosphatidyltransferase [Armatimonadota bacterium]|nr:CDP-diacylglycerol--serine O-phosphatidyltransferase [Armatimonadota bacterium]